MSFDPKRGSYYRMPVFFGPTPGPRQWPPGLTCDFEKTPKRKAIAVRYLTDAVKLAAHLPDCFEIWGEPVVTVEITYMWELAWLAGRGYNMGDIKIPAIFKGKNGPIHGTLLMVRFEDLADPILSGREELGHNKLWCEMPPLRYHEGTVATRLSWLHHPFLEISAWDLSDAPAPASDPLHKGLLSYKYLPRTGEWGTADVEYATLTPPAWSGRVTHRQTGKGKVEFLESKWEDLPTLYHLVNAMHALPMLEPRGAVVYEMEGGASGDETHIIE
ncbi:MAG: acetoacetate decarboxylase family protein [Rudaea sp.]|uniref:acetoacetate decarboxylase family protein n=1 Tax=Rudaea sp. TaxID=2136325 RepID=UPI0039E6A5D6